MIAIKERMIQTLPPLPLCPVLSLSAHAAAPGKKKKKKSSGDNHSSPTSHLPPDAPYARLPRTLKPQKSRDADRQCFAALCSARRAHAKAAWHLLVPARQTHDPSKDLDAGTFRGDVSCRTKELSPGSGAVGPPEEQTAGLGV